jgi:hypothetical protein
MELTAAEAWSRILERARPLLPEHTFRIWLEHTEPVALSQHELAVAAGSTFAAEWIDSKYGDLLTDVAERVFGRSIALTFHDRTSEAGGGARVRVSRVEARPEGGHATSAGQAAPVVTQPSPQGGYPGGAGGVELLDLRGHVLASWPVDLQGVYGVDVHPRGVFVANAAADGNVDGGHYGITPGSGGRPRGPRPHPRSGSPSGPAATRPGSCSPASGSPP